MLPCNLATRTSGHLESIGCYVKETQLKSFVKKKKKEAKTTENACEHFMSCMNWRQLIQCMTSVRALRHIRVAKNSSVEGRRRHPFCIRESFAFLTSIIYLYGKQAGEAEYENGRQSEPVWLVLYSYEHVWTVCLGDFPTCEAEEACLNFQPTLQVEPSQIKARFKLLIDEQQQEGPLCFKMEP